MAMLSALLATAAMRSGYRVHAAACTKSMQYFPFDLEAYKQGEDYISAYCPEGTIALYAECNVEATDYRTDPSGEPVPEDFRDADWGLYRPNFQDAFSNDEERDTYNRLAGCRWFPWPVLNDLDGDGNYTEELPGGVVLASGMRFRMYCADPSAAQEKAEEHTFFGRSSKGMTQTVECEGDTVLLKPECEAGLGMEVVSKEMTYGTVMCGGDDIPTYWKPELGGNQMPKAVTCTYKRSGSTSVLVPAYIKTSGRCL